MKKLVALCLGASLLFNNVKPQQPTGDEPPAKRQRVIKSEEVVPFQYWSQNRLNRWLLQAAKEGKSELIDRLLSSSGLSRANVNAVDDFGRTALVHAANAGHSEVIQQLLLYGASSPQPEEISKTALAFIDRGALDMTNYLKQKYPAIFVEEKDLWSLSQYEANQLLMEAAKKGDLRLVIRLLYGPGRMAAVNAKDNYGDTVLMVAVNKGYENVVKILLGAGADVNARDDHDNTALMFAAQAGYESVVRELLKAGANIDDRSYIGWTALMVAANKGYVNVVKILLGAGAHVNITANNGNTALMFAANNGHENVVKILLGAGAHVNAQDNNGGAALIYAAREGYEKVVSILLASGAGVNAQDNNGNTALMFAAHGGHEKVVSILLASGADVNAQNDDGDTALIKASKKGHINIARLLLEHLAIPPTEEELETLPDTAKNLIKGLIPFYLQQLTMRAVAEAQQLDAQGLPKDLIMLILEQALGPYIKHGQVQDAISNSLPKDTRPTNDDDGRPAKRRRVEESEE